jgi:hypothetical protein
MNDINYVNDIIELLNKKKSIKRWSHCGKKHLKLGTS